MTRIYLPGPIVARIQAACGRAGIHVTICERGNDTIVDVCGPDGFSAASIRLTSDADSETDEYTHSVTCTQATAARELWPVLSEVITQHVAF